MLLHLVNQPPPSGAFLNHSLCPARSRRSWGLPHLRKNLLALDRTLRFKLATGEDAERGQKRIRFGFGTAVSDVICCAASGYVSKLEIQPVEHQNLSQWMSPESPVWWLVSVSSVYIGMIGFFSLDPSPCISPASCDSLR